jgi:apolipoprotein N-acyltransferase
MSRRDSDTKNIRKSGKVGAGLSGPMGQPVPAGGAGLLRRRITSLVLCLVPAGLLQVAFAPWDLWPLAYVALAPWVIGLALAPSRRWGLFSAWLGSLVFWGAVLYWLTWITLIGYLAGIAYLTLYWLVAAAILRAAVRRNQPMWIVLPLVWVALEFIRANAQDLYLGPTFPWFALAHSQYRQTILIQLADITGVYGVSFIVAMANGLVVDIILASIARHQHPAGAASGLKAPIVLVANQRRRLIAGPACLCAALAAALAYGAWQLSRDTRTEGPVIGIVQRAYPISLAGRNATQEQILDSHLDATRTFLDSGVRPDLVIWPETMLPVGLNRQMIDLDPNSLKGDYLRGLAAKLAGPGAWDPKYNEAFLHLVLRELLRDGTVDKDGTFEPSKRQLAAKVLAMSGRLGCPILAGGTTIHRNDRPLFRKDEWLVRNSALWLDPNAPGAPIYSKRHLVPFSECVPFKDSWLGLHKLLRQFVPDVMDQLAPGPDITRFDLSRPAGKWRVVSPICYEGTIAPLCRRMVCQDGQKKADIMANLSNDGWFVYSWGGAYRASTEQAQHLSHYCFRAVENRVPVVRAVNTGVSASIDSNGRIVAEVRRGGTNTMISGTLLLDGARGGAIEYLPGHGLKVLVDHRTSWYSLVGERFALAVVLAAAAWVAGMFALCGRRKDLAIET